MSHLLFADDCYFFFRASQVEASIMKHILQYYQGVSGQMINNNKSSVTFSPNTKMGDRAGVCEVLQVQETGNRGTKKITLVCLCVWEEITWRFLVY